MAGRGPAPKAPDQRRRRNKPAAAKPAPAKKRAPAKRKSTASTKTTESPKSTVLSGVPLLPKTYKVRVWDQDLGEHRAEEQEYLDSTREWYEAWKTSTVAVRLERIHWLALRRAARLQDLFDRGDVSQAGELRKIEANFGGSVYDLQRLGYHGKAEEDDPEQQEPAASTGPGGNVVDLRTRLSAKK